MNSDSGNSFLLNSGNQLNGSNGNQSFLQQSMSQQFSFNNSLQTTPYMTQQTNPTFMQSTANTLQNGAMPSDLTNSMLGQGNVHFQGNGTLQNTGMSNNPSQLMPGSSFVQGSAVEWRGQLSAADRYHVVNQLGKAIQQALPPTHQSFSKVESLARSLEQHIFESAESRTGYLEKIGEQMTNIQKKGEFVTYSALQVRQQDLNANNGNNDFLQLGGDANSFHQRRTSNTFANEFLLDDPSSSQIAGLKTEAGNSSANTPTFLPNEPAPTGKNQQSQIASVKAEPSQNAKSASPNSAADSPGVKQDDPKSATTEVKTEGGPKGDVHTTIAGMRVTLLDLTKAEKNSVIAKLEQIRPTYTRIDSLIKTLLSRGGDNEMEKVRKLSGMKQMIGAQLDVVDQDIFFIRPDTLQQLLPSLNQYFVYAELLTNATNGGQQPQRAGQPMAQRPQMGGGMSPAPMNQRMMNQSMNPMTQGQAPNQQFMQANASPMISPAVTQASPQIRPNMFQQQQGNRPMQQMAMRPMVGAQAMQYSQQMQAIQARQMSIQQQLQQIQQMRQGQISPDQLQNLEMRQQDLMRQQQILYHQMTSMGQQQQQSTMINPAMMMRPQNQQQQLMEGQFDQNQAANQQQQRMFQQQRMYMQQMQMNMGRPARPVMNQQQLMQQQQQIQQMQAMQRQQNAAQQQQISNQQLQELMGLSSGNEPFGGLDNLQQSPLALEGLTEQGSPQMTMNPASMSGGMPNLMFQSFQVNNGLTNNQVANPQSDLNSLAQNLSPHMNASLAAQQQLARQQQQMRNQQVEQMQRMGNGMNNEFSFNDSAGITQALATSPNEADKKPALDISTSNLANFGGQTAQQLSAGDNWEAEFNVQQTESKEGFDDFFNLDYEPPTADTGLDEFDAFLDQNLDEKDFNSLGTAKKRSRDPEDDFGEFEKKSKKSAYSLKDELDQITLEHHPISYSIKNTQAQSANETNICFTLNSVTFTLTVKDKQQYELGNFKGLIKFSTTAVPDNLTKIVGGHTSASSTSRVSDIVKILVPEIIKK